MRALFTLLAIAVPAVAAAAPVRTKIPVLSVCVKTDGSMLVKRKCAKSETKATLGTLTATGSGPQGPKGDRGSQGPQGAQGPQGPTGASGGLNINNCIKRSVTASGGNTIHVESACLVSEYVLTWGLRTNAFGTSIESVDVRAGTNSILANKDMPGYVTADVRGPDLVTVFSATLDVYCCRP